MKTYVFAHGVLFPGNSPEEIAAAIHLYLNPLPYIKEQPARNGARRRRK